MSSEEVEPPQESVCIADESVCWKCGISGEKGRLGLIMCGHMFCLNCVGVNNAKYGNFACPIEGCGVVGKWHDPKDPKCDPIVRDLFQHEEELLENFEGNIRNALHSLTFPLVFANRQRERRRKAEAQLEEKWKQYRIQMNAYGRFLKSQCENGMKTVHKAYASRTKMVDMYRKQGAELRATQHQVYLLQNEVKRLMCERNGVDPSSVRSPGEPIEDEVFLPSTQGTIPPSGLNFPPTPTPSICTGVGSQLEPSQPRMNPQIQGNKSPPQPAPTGFHQPQHQAGQRDNCFRNPPDRQLRYCGIKPKIRNDTFRKSPLPSGQKFRQQPKVGHGERPKKLPQGDLRNHGHNLDARDDGVRKPSPHSGQRFPQKQAGNGEFQFHMNPQVPGNEFPQNQPQQLDHQPQEFAHQPQQQASKRDASPSRQVHYRAFKPFGRNDLIRKSPLPSGKQPPVDSMDFEFYGD